MNKSIEKIPTYALPYLVNGDSTNLTDEEQQEIDNIIREHHIEMRHDYKFLLHAAKQLRGVGAVLVLGAPAVDLRHLGIASAKQEDTA